MMTLLRRYFKPAALAGAAAILAAGCTHITYKLPDEFLSDGDLLMASMKDAALKAAANPALAAENGPFQLTSLATEEETENLLYSSFEDALVGALGAKVVEVVAAADKDEGVGAVKYRLIECRIVNAQADGGRVKRIGRTVAHIRIYGAAKGGLLWAGEYVGEAENVVPASAVAKLADDRIIPIGPQQPEAGQNPFVEPLLVTGITGALIYLFAISASAD